MIFTAFAKPGSESKRPVIPHNLQDYLSLVDDSGRVIRPDKQGSLIEKVPKMLEHLGIAPDEWLLTVTRL